MTYRKRARKALAALLLILAVAAAVALGGWQMMTKAYASAQEQVNGRPVTYFAELVNNSFFGNSAQAEAEEAIKKAVQDYYDKNGIEYDPAIFPADHDCEHCHADANGKS